VQVGAAKIFAEWLAPSDRAAVGDLRDVAKLAQDSVRASTRTVVAAPVADAERGTGRSEWPAGGQVRGGTTVRLYQRVGSRSPRRRPRRPQSAPTA